MTDPTLNKRAGLRRVTIGYAAPVHDPELESIIRSLIAGGESYYVEFKSGWTTGENDRTPRDLKEVAKDIGEAITAFANSDGGDLLVGVEDSGRITGIPWKGNQLLYLLQAPQNMVQTSNVGVKVHEVLIDGHHVLLFRVADHPEETVTTSSGRCLWRRGTSSTPVPPAEVERRRKHKLGDTSYEAQPVPLASIHDVYVPTEAIRSRPHLVQLASRNITDLLSYWNLIEGRGDQVILRRAALLLFAKDPLRWHPNNRIRIRRIPGLKEEFGRRLNVNETEILGPIVKVLPEATSRLRSGLRVDTRAADLFSTAQLLPSEAVDECIVNAVAHRNYAIEGSAIEIVMFPDRVEFKSPGGLPEPLTINDLRQRKGAHRSRNPLIMRVLRDLGWTRDLGEGMRRIFGSMSQVELHEPELEQTADTFVVRLSTQSLYDQSTQSWIAAYGPFGLEPNERRYMVALRKANGSMSVDRLARSLSESFDTTKNMVAGLEKKGLLWHAPHSRTYRIVEPLSVPHERAYRRFAELKISMNATVILPVATLMRVVGAPDERSAMSAIERLRENGILIPVGKGAWKLGGSFLQYARAREDAA